MKCKRDGKKRETLYSLCRFVLGLLCQPVSWCRWTILRLSAGRKFKQKTTKLTNNYIKHAKILYCFVFHISTSNLVTAKFITLLLSVYQIYLKTNFTKELCKFEYHNKLYLKMKNIIHVYFNFVTLTINLKLRR